MRLMMVILILVILVFAGLAGFAYLGDMTPAPAPVSVPLELAPVAGDAPASAGADGN